MAIVLRIVIPCFNESARLRPELLLEYVASAHRDTSFLFVDDGSTDATASILSEMAARSDGGITVLTLPENGGKARAVQLGILWAFEKQPRFVGYWDADLATPLAAIADFMEVFKARSEVEVVMGARVKLLGRDIRRTTVRHYSGRVLATAASLVLGLAVYDTQCGAKIFRATETAREVFAAPLKAQWVFDVEILSRYVATMGRSHAQARICEVPLTQWTAMPGSKLKIR